MEDYVAPFVNLLEGDIDEVRGPGWSQELNDYGRIYDYGNALADFSVWESAFEAKPINPTSLQSPHSSSFQTQVTVTTGENGALAFPELLADSSAEASSGKPAISDDAANSKPLGGFQFSESGDIGPRDAELRSEMLELLNIFQIVYESKMDVDKRSLLKKCVSMCERIMDRFYRLPQVVTMHEQAKSLLQMLERGEVDRPGMSSKTSSNFATEDGASSERSSLDNLKANVKEALDTVDREAEEIESHSKDPDEGKEVDGVHIREGIWYCKTHTDQEECKQCGVDYRLLNQVHRERIEEEKVDVTLRSEQQRLEVLENEKTTLSRPDPGTQEVTTEDNEDAEDFQTISKDLNEELARAREKEEAEFLKLFSTFQIS